ncbi:hypothetical protein L916_17431 [Phytophthora nicotianae]|uniref:Uncharacterized protein n=1 Tax=Phytophthora nicotianae TaxID=4792 RepID=W2I5D0_PHYNI|nr:hypothetical protein L916_17431 [Phytophthora nicotianae]
MISAGYAVNLDDQVKIAKNNVVMEKTVIMYSHGLRVVVLPAQKKWRHIPLSGPKICLAVRHCTRGGPAW